jgi:hypothetical protein
MDDQKLKDYFKFDEDGLQANRSGNFSAKQKKELSSEDSSSIQRRRRAAVIFFILGILLWLMVIGFLIFKGVGYMVQNSVLLICPGPGGLVLLLASIYIFRSSFSIKQIYLLKKVEGPINIVKAERTKSDSVTHGTERYVTYELHIGSISFDVLPDLADIMMQGNAYAVYYTEPNDNFGGRIWSAEFMSKAN